MGLNFSIKTYIKNNNLTNSLKWLLNNSWDGNVPLEININNEIYKINGNGLRNTKYSYLTKEGVIKEYDILQYNTSLIFDIDLKIINLFFDQEENLKDIFQSVYLGNGKIRIGDFNTTISKVLNQQDVFELNFTAVTNDMSKMITESNSVKKWIGEFSYQSDSILTYLDMENAGNKILFYRGLEFDITINDGINLEPNYLPQTFWIEYHNLIERDKKV